MSLIDEEPWKITFFHEDWTLDKDGKNPEPVSLYATHDQLTGMTEQSREFRDLLETNAGQRINGALINVWEHYCDEKDSHFEYPGGPVFNKHFEIEKGIQMRQQLEDLINDEQD